MTQYGFFIDLSRCTGCNACVISCKQWHDIPPGPVKWLRVYQWEKGSFPDIDLHTLPIMCLHCGNPVCADACPHQAIYKEEKYGAVLVDYNKCQGERKCFEACPYGVPQFEGDERDNRMTKCNMCIDRLGKGLKPICVLSCSLRALEFGPIEELRAKYGNNTHVEGIPEDYAPCRKACPAGVDSGGYIRLIAEGKLKEALALFRETAPFAGILGRVCTHPCESNCQRGKFDESIPLCSLKRFMADNELKTGRDKANPVKITRKDKVAIIGSGPAGLSCAYDLINKGYAVTVFEAALQAGGLLRYGIPAYRLPKDVLDNEIGYIKDLGVEIKTGAPVRKLDDIFAQGYKSLFIAAGAWRSLKLNVPGEDAKGVIYSLDFLNQVNSGNKVKLGRRVAVIGGGSVAIDSARTALQLGAKEVHLICLECRDLSSKDRMLAQDREIEEAEEEGVIIHPSSGINRLLAKNGKVTGVETVECISVREVDGTFAPEYGKCALETLEIDNVIVAIGQAGDKTVLPDGLKLNNNQTISVDLLTLQTSVKGVFAGGDAVGGNADVISAIASGKQAAISIDRYLSGLDLKEGRHLPAKADRAGTGAKSARSPVLKVGKRRAFAEIDLGLDEKTAFDQANQCLKCDVTQPSVIFKPAEPKRQIVHWDAGKALELWQKRHPDNGETLPDIFEDVEDITDFPEEIVGRNKLVLKPKNTAELMHYTTDDE